MPHERERFRAFRSTSLSLFPPLSLSLFTSLSLSLSLSLFPPLSLFIFPPRIKQKTKKLKTVLHLGRGPPLRDRARLFCLPPADAGADSRA